MNHNVLRIFVIFSIVLGYAVLSSAQIGSSDEDPLLNEDAYPEVMGEAEKYVMDSLLRADSLNRDMLAKRDSMARLDSLRAALRKRRKPEIKIKTVTLGDSTTLNYDSIQLRPSTLFMPLVFERQETYRNDLAFYADSIGIDKQGFNYDTHVLDSIARENYNNRRTRYSTMLNHPDLVTYNLDNLPEPLKQYEINADPTTRKLELEETNTDPLVAEIAEDLEVPVIKLRNWLHSFDASLQFSQAFVSDNWYQGGNNSLNILGNMAWSVALNQNVHPNLLFENTVQYKINVSSAPQDTVRNYSLSEDLLQINTKFGYKAIRNWYYSATMQFKTQIFNNYASNSNNLSASFLTPGELNLGLGMTYGTKSKKGFATFNLSIAPLSYNMKICRENDRVDPTSMGVDAGKHIKGSFGSNLEAKLVWAITPAINWTSRLYAFTNYDYVQGDWENQFNFTINKYLSTQIYVHLRYDNSVETTSDWGDWQLKEILSFGLRYSFAMN